MDKNHVGPPNTGHRTRATERRSNHPSDTPPSLPCRLRRARFAEALDRHSSVYIPPSLFMAKKRAKSGKTVRRRRRRRTVSGGRRVLTRNREIKYYEEEEKEVVNDVCETVVCEENSGDTLVGNSEECGVCLDCFVQGENGTILSKCGHGFHTDCIRPWLSGSETCPMCRNKVEHNIFNPVYLDVNIYTSSSSADESPDHTGATAKIPLHTGATAKIPLYELARRQRMFERLGRFKNRVGKLRRGISFRSPRDEYEHVFARQRYGFKCGLVAMVCMFNVFVCNYRSNLSIALCSIPSIWVLLQMDALSLLSQSRWQLNSMIARGVVLYAHPPALFLMVTWAAIFALNVSTLWCHIGPNWTIEGQGLCDWFSWRHLLSYISTVLVLVSITYDKINWEWWRWIDARNNNKTVCGHFPPRNLQHIHPLVYLGTWPTTAHEERYWPCHFPRRDGLGRNRIAKQRRRERRKQRAQNRRERQARLRYSCIQDQIDLAIEEWTRLTGDNDAKTPDFMHWIKHNDSAGFSSVKLALRELKKWVVKRGHEVCQAHRREPFPTALYQLVLNKFWLPQFGNWAEDLGPYLHVIPASTEQRATTLEFVSQPSLAPSLYLAERELMLGTI